MQSDQIFREKIIEPVSQPSEAPEKKGYVSDTLDGSETPLHTPETSEERDLELWEGLHRRKYSEDYFKVREISDEFMVKMPMAEINKYVRAEMQKQGLAMTVDNYEKFLKDIETEIGSDNMELFQRFRKITGYIRAISRLNKAKELKEKYLVE